MTRKMQRNRAGHTAHSATTLSFYLTQEKPHAVMLTETLGNCHRLNLVATLPSVVVKRRDVVA